MPLQRLRRLRCAVVFGLVSTLAVPAAGSADVVGDVTRMLEEGLDSPLIVQWLERNDARPGVLDAEQLIRLKRAGASVELIAELIERSGPPPADGGPPPGTTPAARPEQAVGDAAAAAQVELQFVYKPRHDIDDDFEDPWDLFAYLDGELVGRIADQSSLTRREPTRVTLDLEPGRHTLRLMRERHRRAGRRGFRHEARVCPDVIRFEVGPGSGWQLRSRWVQPRFALTRKGGPLAWELLRDGRKVAGGEPFGAAATDWLPLCEDLESNVEPGRRVPRAVRRELERCVGWASLWENLPAVPDRGAVRPVPAR